MSDAALFAAGDKNLAQEARARLGIGAYGAAVREAIKRRSARSLDDDLDEGLAAVSPTWLQWTVEAVPPWTAAEARGAPTLIDYTAWTLFGVTACAHPSASGFRINVLILRERDGTLRQTRVRELNDVEMLPAAGSVCLIAGSLCQRADAEIGYPTLLPLEAARRNPLACELDALDAHGIGALESAGYLSAAYAHAWRVRARDREAGVVIADGWLGARDRLRKEAEAFEAAHAQRDELSGALGFEPGARAGAAAPTPRARSMRI